MSDFDNSSRYMKKIAGLGCICGVILITLGSLIVPRTGDMSNILDMQKAFGSNPRVLQMSALLLVFGFWGLFIGVIGIRDSINGTGAAWAKIGFYFNLMGTAIWTTGMSLDISYPAAIVNWLSSPEADKQVAYSVVTVLSPLGFGRGLFPVEVIIIWLSYIFLSLGMVKSNNRPRWHGYAGLFIGVFGLILGIFMVFTGREKLLTYYIIIMFFILVWFLIIGIWMLWIQKND